MRKMMIAALVVGIGGAAAYQWRSSVPSARSAQEHDNRLLQNRAWIDHVPKDDRDTIQLFLVLTKGPARGPRGPFGVFEAVSGWQGRFEAFRYESHGEELRVIYPQTNERETLTVKPSACSEQGMDYCLDVSGSKRGVKRYYSRKGWEVRSVDEAEALAAGL